MYSLVTAIEAGDQRRSGCRRKSAPSLERAGRQSAHRRHALRVSEHEEITNNVVQVWSSN